MSIQAVGIIMVVAMLVTPAATAQLLVIRVGRMMTIAATLAAIPAVLGPYVSFYLNLVYGASIVLVESILFVVAMSVGPRTGLRAWLRRRTEVLPGAGQT